MGTRASGPGEAGWLEGHLGTGFGAGDQAGGGARGTPHRLLRRQSVFRCLTVDDGTGPPF